MASLDGMCMDNAAFQRSHSSLIYNDGTREFKWAHSLSGCARGPVDLGDEVGAEGPFVFGLVLSTSHFALRFVRHFEMGTNSVHFSVAGAPVPCRAAQALTSRV